MSLCPAHNRLRSVIEWMLVLAGLVTVYVMGAKTGSGLWAWTTSWWYQLTERRYF